jgi:altronate dehydratase
METPTRHPVEILSGLGATGVEVMLAAVAGPPMQGHPMIPLLQISGDGATIAKWGEELDAEFEDGGQDAEQICGELLDLLARTASREYTPRLYGQGNTDFQLTRGRLGISM